MGEYWVMKVFQGLRGRTRLWKSYGLKFGGFERSGFLLLLGIFQSLALKLSAVQPETGWTVKLIKGCCR